MKARELAQGKWRNLLPALGIPEHVLSGKHYPCPKDGSGTDRFRFADREGSGSYFCECSNGSSGGIALVMCCRGLTYQEAAKEIEAKIGTIGPDREHTRSRADPVPRLRAMQRKAAAAGDAVVDYLAGRGLKPTAVTQQARNDYWQDGAILDTFDAMVCKVTAADGKPATYHVTYLKDGKKAPVNPPRKLMPAVRPIKGGAIRLFQPAEVMGVAEGIESALSAAAIYRIPVWSCISAGLLESFEPPTGVRVLTIFGDNDRNMVGQRAAYCLAERLVRRGIDCNVEIPANPGADFNDVLLEGGKTMGKVPNDRQSA